MVLQDLEEEGQKLLAHRIQSKEEVVVVEVGKEDETHQEDQDEPPGL